MSSRNVCGVVRMNGDVYIEQFAARLGKNRAANLAKNILDAIEDVVPAPQTDALDATVVAIASELER